jgi:hypothetical protein
MFYAVGLNIFTHVTNPAKALWNRKRQYHIEWEDKIERKISDDVVLQIASQMDTILQYLENELCNEIQPCELRCCHYKILRIDGLGARKNKGQEPVAILEMIRYKRHNR